MRCRKLPMHTRNRILNYFSHKYQGKFFNEDEIISELSDSLRTVTQKSREKTILFFYCYTLGTGQLQLQRSRPIGSPIPRRRSVLRTADRHSTPLRGLSPGRRHRPSGNDRTQNVLHTRGNRRRDRRTRRRLHVAHRRFLFRRNMPTPSQSTLGDDQGDHRLRSLLAFDGTLQRRSRRVSRHTIGDGESRRRAARQTD